MDSRPTKVCTAPESPKPRMSGQRVSQNMKKASRNERPISTTTVAVANTELGADEPRDCCRSLVQLLGRLVATFAYGVRHAMGQMVVEETEGDSLQGLGGG